MRSRDAAGTDLVWFQQFRTAKAPMWVSEAEQWVREEAFAWWREPGKRRDLRVAHLDGEVVAVGGREWWGDDTVFVAACVVHADHRRAGIGRELLADLLLTGSAFAAKVWRVHERNEPAIALSRSLGALQAPAAPGGYFEFFLDPAAEPLA